MYCRFQHFIIQVIKNDYGTNNRDPMKPNLE